MSRAFVIRPFGKKKDSSGTEIDFEQVHKELIAPALAANGLMGSTTGEIVDAGNIREDMFALIVEADLVVCDITILNANVFYELGIRHALRRKHTILIKGTPIKDGTPFDLLTDRYLAYDITNPADTKDKLVEMIAASLKSDRATDSPVFQMLPSLPEANVSTIQVVPFDFREDVERAQAAKSKGWLRLLSDEIRGQRFQWEGLKLVATAQWDAKDYEGARRNWETIRGTYPHDIDANLALANIYERLYRDRQQAELLEASEQAIDRVLHNKSINRKQRAESLALRGRNQKTRWRLEFEGLKTLEDRRKAAMNRALVRSYEAYRAAFLEDLNHFYPGLNALQMGTILLDLPKDDTWYQAFEDDRQADQYRTELAGQVSSLSALVPTSVEAALNRMDESNSDRLWAKISKADVLFLTDDKRKARVIDAYRDAIPEDKPFAWDAARGQLELFADLGVKADPARQVITAIDTRFAAQQPSGPKKPLHLVLFAGHRVDAPGRIEPRFPKELEGRAKKLIREALEEQLDAEYEVVGLASAAPGTDILSHEACADVGLPSTICLPMPVDDFARLAFENLDSWRARFLDLRGHHKILELSDRAELPRWLQGTHMDFWERGNCWVMQMALSWGAERITLIALWDGKDTGDAPGGTAQMVQLARDAGTVRIRSIHTKELLS